MRYRLLCDKRVPGDAYLLLSGGHRGGFWLLPFPTAGFRRWLVHSHRKFFAFGIIRRARRHIRFCQQRQFQFFHFAAGLFPATRFDGHRKRLGDHHLAAVRLRDNLQTGRESQRAIQPALHAM